MQRKSMMRPSCLVVAAFAMAVGSLMASAACGQDAVVAPDAPPAVAPVEPVAPRPVAPAPQAAPSPLKGVVKALRSGPLLIHGNFCGVGNRPGGAPIDALDAACMRHDACTRTGKLPGCACNDRLRIEASLVAEDPLTSPDVKAVATATAAAMSVLICKTGGTLAVPIPVLPAR